MKTPRLLLVEPPFHRLYKDSYGLCKAPLGLSSLAASALAAGAEVKIVNADFHPDPEPFFIPYLCGPGYAAYREAMASGDHPAFATIDKAVADFSPDIVGMSLRTPALASARIAAARIKRISPGVLVLAGGPHPSAAPEDTLTHPEFDAAVRGEGEKTLAAFLNAFSRGRLALDEPGLVVKKDGRISANAPGEPIQDLDSLPFPASLGPDCIIGGDAYPPRAFAFVFTSRGCPFRCAYCSSHSVWTRRPRARSNQSVLDELRLLAGRGVSHVHFDDDTFGLTRSRLLALCRDLERAGLSLTFSCETHVNLIDAESAEALARAGFSTIQLGLESGDDAILRAIGKGFTANRAEQAAGLVKAAGMRLEAFFMVGFPDETELSLSNTRNLMERLDCDKIIYSIFTPYPDTPLYRRCLELGLIGPCFDPSRHNHQSPENAFCPKIPPGRFRHIAAQIEELAARKNEEGREKEKERNRGRNVK